MEDKEIIHQYIVPCSSCGRECCRPNTHLFKCKNCKKKRSKKYISPKQKELKKIMIHLKKIRAKNQQPKQIVTPRGPLSLEPCNVCWRAHYWVRRNFEDPKKCESCGKVGVKLDWSNKDHKYLLVRESWQRVCKSCHQKYDYLHGLRKGKTKSQRTKRSYPYKNKYD